MQCKTFIALLLLLGLCLDYAECYSALQDARIIAEYRRQRQLDHAKIARTLVHQADWAAVGSISTNKDVLGYPMVNIISIDDSDGNGASTGEIRFLLTDLDFTGPDWRHDNKVTFLLTDAQPLHCQHDGKDPMEPTCARTIISGQVKQLDTTSDSYVAILSAFKKRHPAAANWLKVHSFYLCQLDIENIFVLDFYGGPHKVTAADYYAAQL